MCISRGRRTIDLLLDLSGGGCACRVESSPRGDSYHSLRSKSEVQQVCGAMMSIDEFGGNPLQKQIEQNGKKQHTKKVIATIQTNTVDRHVHSHRSIVSFGPLLAWRTKK